MSVQHHQIQDFFFIDWYIYKPIFCGNGLSLFLYRPIYLYIFRCFYVIVPCHAVDYKPTEFFSAC